MPSVEDDEDPLGTYEGGLNSAILRYRGAKDLEPKTKLTQDIVLRETQLHALLNPEAPGRPTQDGGDKNLHFAITYNEKTEMFAINGKSFEPPKVPVLLQLLTGTRPEELLPKDSVITLPRNKSISISILPGDFDAPVRP